MSTPPDQVLVTVASRHGATAEIETARARAIEQSGAGLVAVALAVTQHPDPRQFDAVVLGSAVYAGRWLEPARQYGAGQAGLLRTQPTWLFSSGPIGEPPFPPDEPYDVASLRTLAGARGARRLPGAAREGAAQLRRERDGDRHARTGR